MKQKTALVLSGGGARGIAHIGVIEELEKRDYEISSVAGASMGSVIGAVYSMGKLPEFKEWICSLDRMKVFRLIDFTFSWQGLIKAEKVLNEMKHFIPDGNIEDMRIPYSAVAVDLVNKKEVVFSKGSVYNAIRASIAIPTVVTPVETGEGLLIDGGVLNNIPVNHVHRNQGDIMVAVDVNADIPVVRPKVTKKEHEANQSAYQKKLDEFYAYLKNIHIFPHEEKLGYLDLIDQTISLMMLHMSQDNLKDTPPDILVNISRNSCNTFDFYRAEELIEMGRLAAQEALDKKK